MQIPNEFKKYIPTNIQVCGSLEEIFKNTPLNLSACFEERLEAIEMDIFKQYTDQGRFAKVLNIILIDHFESLQEFYDTFGIDGTWCEILWKGGFHTPPRRSMVDRLVHEYNINPNYLVLGIGSPMVNIPNN